MVLPSDPLVVFPLAIPYAQAYQRNLLMDCNKGNS